MNSTRIRPRSPASRLSDPATSQEAEEHGNASGVRDGQARQIVEALRRHEGTTSAELARFADVDRYVSDRRLADLERLGLVAKGESRKCKVTRRNSITWFCTDGGEQGRLF